MLLRKQFSFFWLVLNVLTGGISTLFLGRLLNVYETDAWYTKWYYWALGIIFGFLPAMIMLFVLIVQVTVKVCVKLGLFGYKIYSVPYFWILFLVVPLVGWICFGLLFLYINIGYVVLLFFGKGEKYI